MRSLIKNQTTNLMLLLVLVSLFHATNSFSTGLQKRPASTASAGDIVERNQLLQAGQKDEFDFAEEVFKGWMEDKKGSKERSFRQVKPTLRFGRADPAMASVARLEQLNRANKAEYFVTADSDDDDDNNNSNNHRQQELSAPGGEGYVVMI